jgi:hypothetical protein
MMMISRAIKANSKFYPFWPVSWMRSDQAQENRSEKKAEDTSRI